jgi:superfamily II DNA or RNA helicase
MVRDQFSQPVEDIVFLREKSGNDKIPDTNYAIQPTGMFDFGLSEQILQALYKEDLDWETTDAFDERFDCGYKFSNGILDVYDGLNYQHRYYGIDTVKESLKKGCGTIVWATGAGKSFLQASLVENVWRNTKQPFKCLILVPGLNLVSQLVENFEEYGVNFTYSGWTGGSKGMSLKETEVVICNSENFCSKFDINRKWIEKIDLLLVDECHKISAGAVVTKNIQKIKTPHKFGFTGTIPKDKMDEWKVIGTFGPIIYEKNSKELRDEGFLSNVSIKILKLNHDTMERMYYRRELQYIYESPKRHILVKNLVKKLNGNVLIIVNHTKHGEDTLDIMSSIGGKECFFISGEMPVDERMDIIRKMEEQSNIVTVANSTCFSTGINIKNLPYIIFLSGGKSFIRIVQSIGRGLRLHPSKNKLTLFDICDNLKYSMEHLEKRKQFYDEQQIEWKEIEIK